MVHLISKLGLDRQAFGLAQHTQYVNISTFLLTLAIFQLAKLVMSDDWDEEKTPASVSLRACMCCSSHFTTFSLPQTKSFGGGFGESTGGGFSSSDDSGFGSKKNGDMNGHSGFGKPSRGFGGGRGRGGGGFGSSKSTTCPINLI